eukprot:TRINITY_DN2326_c0_g3_i1.p2 TRINITY_DN2326_c0_g3~~TRINITY_DN2326_c0_g3_i1.p2  ORF type:complete len:120 (+),score=2.54 TRINITY_DN2326_c0_g3_i1:397-756(+)
MPAPAATCRQGHDASALLYQRRSNSTILARYLCRCLARIGSPKLQRAQEMEGGAAGSYAIDTILELSDSLRWLALAIPPVEKKKKSCLQRKKATGLCTMPQRGVPRAIPRRHTLAFLQA